MRKINWQILIFVFSFLTVLLYAETLNFGPIEAVKSKIRELRKTSPAITTTLIILDSPLSGNYYNNSTYKLVSSKSPYTVTGNVYIYGPLSIEAGVTVKFSGSYSFSTKDVSANGTATNPIKFTSGRVSPAVGDYSYVDIGDAYYNKSVNLNYVIFEYASSVYTYGDSNSKITNCSFINCNYLRLHDKQGQLKNCNLEGYIYISQSPQILYCNISSGTIFSSQSAGQYKINNCNFIQRRPGYSYFISNDANWTIDATNNWWGTTISTTIASYINSTAGTVTYSPYLSSPVSNAGPQ
ncbi:MAG: hypothetical protein AB1633_07720 [Elusimicrobiota bacterium]